MLSFDNRFIRELPGDPSDRNHPRQVQGACWSPVTPVPVSTPQLLAFSPEVANLLDISPHHLPQREMIDALAGNHLLPGMSTYATCYGGYQFGHWAGQLGDGRAIYLGELINRAGQRWELQLKGAGPTPYSRRADGRAVLRSSVREFLCSEAMHHLGIPTTRALSLIGTGETVVRDMFYDGNPGCEPGAIVCRVAPSFIRFGHFEIHAARGDGPLLKRLVDFTITRDFPQLQSAPSQLYDDWYREVCARTAHLMAQWMRVGFVHGVMNTDNMSILGLTIDYGPYGWIDNFDPSWTPNTTDAQGRRYCFGRQPEIARWNLERLGEALTALVSPHGFEAGCTTYDSAYAKSMSAALAGKLGLAEFRDDDVDLANELFDLMHRAEVDMTDFFRSLAKLDDAAPDMAALQGAFYQEALYHEHRDVFANWLQRYAARLRQEGRERGERTAQMNAANPRFVLRNYLAQRAIERATEGDVSLIHELLDVLRRPYDEQPGREVYSAKRPEWARHKAGCSMLSCSS